MPIQERLGEQQHVVAPLSERRHLDREHRQSVVEVFPELPFLHALGQVAIGRSNHPNVDITRHRGADALHLTAAAVHQQIRNLEEQVGVPLFDRLPRGMQLTLAGEIVIAAVRRGQRDFDNALTQVEDLRALRRGHVNLDYYHYLEYESHAK